MNNFYKIEIEGIKAIAIISLILYYAQIVVYGFPLFSGGFIGIDMFFVISGYLTTYKIIIESSNKRNFSIKTNNSYIIICYNCFFTICLFLLTS